MKINALCIILCVLFICCSRNNTNDLDIENLIPIDSKETVEELLEKNLETFNKYSSDKDLLTILWLMSEYERFSNMENIPTKPVEDTQMPLSDKDINLEQNARLLMGMSPEKAVNILSVMDIHDVTDVFKKADGIANKEGNNSIVPYWLQLMDQERAREIQKKLVRATVSVTAD